MDWNLADEHFPDAVPLVDRIHDQAKPTDAAKSIYGAGTDLSKHWAHERYDELDDGDSLKSRSNEILIEYYYCHTANAMLDSTQSRSCEQQPRRMRRLQVDTKVLYQVRLEVRSAA